MVSTAMSALAHNVSALSQSRQGRSALPAQRPARRSIAVKADYDQFTIPPWSAEEPQPTNGLPPIEKDRSDHIKEQFMNNFKPPAEYYSHNTMGVSDAEWRGRVDLAAVYRLCVFFGFHEGIVNHMTVWIPEDEIMLVHSFGLGWDEVTASNLLSVDKEGNVLRGSGNPEATAFFIHSRLHLNRPNTGCVLHTHMPYVTALAGLDYPRLPMIHQNTMRFWNDIVYDPKMALRIESSEEGDRLAAMLGDKHVLLQSNHGPMICAEDPKIAMDLLFYLERAAKLVYIARSNGLPLREAAPEVAGAFKDYTSQSPHYAHMHFESLKRRLCRDPLHADFSS